MKTRELLTALFLGGGLSLGAQSAAPDTFLIDQYELEGVVISADKRESTVLEAPVSVTSLSGLKVRNDRIQASTDLTGPIPNLYMPDYGSRLTSPIYIRGIGSRINSPSVGFYMDEVALFEKAAFNMDLYDVERIEVLRGPQGTLYGRNTLGGIVHVITRDPGNTPGLRLAAEMGNFGHQQYQARAEAPLIKDKLFLQAGGHFRSLGGYYINQFNGERVDDLTSGGGRVKVLWKPDPKTRVVFQAYTDLGREGGYPYAVVPEEEEDLVINYDHASSYSRQMAGSSLQWERTGTTLRWNSITSYQWLQGFQDIDQDFTPADLLSVTQEQDQHLLTQELRISNVDPDARFSWVSGIYGFYQWNFQEVNVDFGEAGIAAFGLPFGSYAYQKVNDMENYGAALFGQGSFRDLLVSDLDLTFGLRIDYEEDALDYIYERYADGATLPTEDFSSGFSFFEVLPKVSLSYHWNDLQMNYLSVTRGYKSGGFNTTFEREEDRSFRPEYSWNYEAGWKIASSNHRMTLRMAVFHIDWKDLQVYQPVPSGRGSMLKNAASAYSQGAEVELTLLPVNNLQVTANAGYADARFREFVPDPGEETDFGGNRVPYVPNLTGFLSASYRLPLNGEWLHDLVIASNWRQTGTIYWDNSNSVSQDPYGLFAANISLGIKDFHIRVWAENLLDTQYRSFQFSALGNQYAQPGKPRRMGITLTYSL